MKIHEWNEHRRTRVKSNDICCSIRFIHNNSVASAAFTKCAANEFFQLKFYCHVSELIRRCSGKASILFSVLNFQIRRWPNRNWLILFSIGASVSAGRPTFISSIECIRHSPSNDEALMVYVHIFYA